jgi:hypothetical protein
MMIQRNQQPLTVEDINRLAPSALAREAYSDRSHRYTYIPTLEVIDGMKNAGFLPFAATQSRTRDANRREYTKHMIRFRHMDSMLSLSVGDSLAEVVLVNSHDGTSSYKLMAGLFRLVCLNGMVVSESMQDSITIRHSGAVIDAVIEGSNRIVQNAPKILDAVHSWTSLQLTSGEQSAFAEAAHTIRFADAEGKVETPITAAQLLQPRRRDDNSPDLWRTLNRVQENVIRGGLTAVGRDAHGRRRHTTTREVKGIDQDVRLNRALWQLAERMAELKSA